MLHRSPCCCRFLLVLALVIGSVGRAEAAEREPVRVFIFAGQSNMVGSDSKVADVKRFPPFVGVEKPREDVRFWYCIGRERKTRSNGWGPLEPVNGVVGPELTFARSVTARIEAPIAIIKVAAGGTHLGGDWNPDEPSGFKMYPLALETVRRSLAELDRTKTPYRLEGFVWHQGENDMFNEEYKRNYGKNLARFLECWRRDLRAPNLRFYIGELCTKTIWGMDLRPRMYAISLGQKAVAKSDPLAEYVPTSHVGVEIGRGVGLHYHYGTLGQLEHGVNYAEAYLRSIGKPAPRRKPLARWPYAKGETVRLYVLAGHRNMEGERAFVQELEELAPRLREDDSAVAFKYDLGGGYRVSDGWEPLGPAGDYDTFGPELSFVRTLKKRRPGPIAIAKFTHSGSQIIDWTPEGSPAKSRHLYPRFIDFVTTSIKELEERGQKVALGGIVYHVGENDMSMPPYRKQAADWLAATIARSRKDLGRPDLAWYLSQQRPTDHERVNSIDVTTALKQLADADPNTTRIEAFELPPQEKQLVIDTAGIVRLGELQAKGIRLPNEN